MYMSLRAGCKKMELPRKKAGHSSRTIVRVVSLKHPVFGLCWSSYKWSNEFYYGDQMVSDSKAISDGFNNFFTIIGLMLANNIEHRHSTSLSDFMNISVHNSLFLELVIDEEIKNKASNYKHK